MKLDCILTAVNENPLYIHFIPIFIKTWNKLYPDVDVKIILIANEIPVKFLDYKDNIILFKPIENVLTSFTSQLIRLYYPCILNYKNGVMITDMDMLPMNRTYYTENIKEFDNNKFIYLRENICSEINQIAMCYNVATPKVWSEIFDISSIEDIRNNITIISNKNVIKEGHGNIGWALDQLILCQKVKDWDKKTNNFIRLQEKNTGFNRLDRLYNFNINNKKIKKMISMGVFSDYHCLRPMKNFESINNKIYDLL